MTATTPEEEAHETKTRFDTHCINHRLCHKQWRRQKMNVNQLCDRGRRLYSRWKRAEKLVAKKGD